MDGPGLEKNSAPKKSSPGFLVKLACFFKSFVTDPNKRLVLLSALLFTLVLPVIIGVLLRLTNDKKLMGAHTNGWITNIFLTFFIFLTCYLAYQNGLELWSDLMELL